MNRITLSLISFILLFLVFSDPIQSQTYHLIDLNNPTGTTPTIDYYVLDVFDARKLQSSIGITKTKEKEILMLNFTAGFHDELNNYFTNIYPAEEGNSPIILNIKKLWLREFEDNEGSKYSRCEINIEFLTPKSQKFHECSVKNEIKLDDNPNILKDNIIISLNTCMSNLEGDEVKQTYFAVLNSNTPATTSKEVVGSQDIYIEGSENVVSSASSNTRIALQGGYSYRLGRIPDGVDEDIKDYYKGLKNGYHLGTDIHYFFNDRNAFGASASFSQAKSSLSDMVLYDIDGTILAQGDIEDNIRLFYIGPSYFNRSISTDSKRYLLYSLTVGYYTYNDKAIVFDEPVSITGGSFGFGLSMGVDFLTSDDFAIGLQASFLMGWLNKVEVDGIELDLEESENLSRIDLSIGIRFLP